MWEEQISNAGTVASAAAIAVNRNNKQAVFKNCALFNDCITEINNLQVDNTKYLGVSMPMYNLIEYSNNYSETPWTLYQSCRDEPNNVITEFKSFKFKL